MERCLDENEIAKYADCLAGFDFIELGEEILIHVQDCNHCKIEILEIARVILFADSKDSE